MQMTAGGVQLPIIELCMVVAHDKNGLIGRDDELPWNCPEDLQHFKKTTSEPDSMILMGRKTWESLPVGKTTGEKLAGRKKIVVSATGKVQPHKDTIVVRSGFSMDIIKMVRPLGIKRIFVIGGGRIFNNYWSECQSLIATLIQGDFGQTARDVTIPLRYISDRFHVLREEKLSDRASVRYCTTRETRTIGNTDWSDLTVSPGTPLNPWFNPARA